MKLKTDNVSFLQGDCNAVQKTFPEEMLIELAHPWVIILTTLMLTSPMS